MDNRIERLRALENAVELVSEAAAGRWKFYEEPLRPGMPRVMEIQQPSGRAVIPWAGFDDADQTKKAKRANAKAIVAAVNFIREHGSALIAELGQEVGAVGDSRRPSDAALAVAFWDARKTINESPDWVTPVEVIHWGDEIVRRAREYGTRTSPAHTSEARDAAGLVAAAKRLDKFSLVILSSVAVEDPEFSERVGAALVDLRNAAHADPCAVKYRKALERIFDCGRFPEGHHSAGDHEFCGSHHADCIAIAREALSEDAAMRQEGE